MDKRNKQKLTDTFVNKKFITRESTPLTKVEKICITFLHKRNSQDTIKP